jgi:alkanesulfonate monooxygenase
MTASLQRATGGRALYNVITGAGGPEQLWWGDAVQHDDRYGRTTEFLDVLRGVWRGGPFGPGRFDQIENGGLPDPLSSEDYPEISLLGSSDAALASASKHADYYLSWLEPFDKLKAKFDRVKERTAQLGRKIKVCSACRHRRRVPPKKRRGRRSDAASRGSTGRWSSASAGPTAANRWVWPDSAPGCRRPSTAIGTSSSNPTSGRASPCCAVARPMASSAAISRSPNGSTNWVQLGADAFILASTPHLEEAYRVGEEVLPLIRGSTSAPALRAVG